jgi:serine/threonine-protein kinase RsbW
MTLELHATAEEVMRAVEALREFARQRGVGERDLFGLALALEECGSNVVNHALRREQKFQVVLQHEDESFVIELRDPGPPFDPTLAQVNQQARDDDLPGGWGIQIVRRYTDQIHYAREGNENVLRLIKRVSPSADEKKLRNKPKPSTSH